MDRFYNIENYVNGSMDGEEHKVFEKAVSEDQQLAEDLEWMEDLSKSVKALNEEALLKSISSAESELANEGFFEQFESTETGGKVVKLGERKAKVRPLFSRKIISIAASFLVVLMATGWWFSNANYSNSAISEGFNTAALREAGIRGDNSRSMNGMATGITAYNNGEVEEAITFFQNYPATDPDFMRAQYYLGALYFSEQQFDQAIAPLDKVAKSNIPDRGLAHKAEWMALLAKFNQDQLDADFDDRLNRITSNEGHGFHTQATELQKKLGSFWRNFSK